MSEEKLERHGLTWHEGRQYIVPPEDKSIKQCHSHGDDHRAYGWSRQVDGRWSDEQIAAYLAGYNGLPISGQ